MMSFKPLIVLCLSVAVSSAQVLDCTEYVGYTMSVELDGETVEYSGVEVYYKYDKNQVDVYEHADGKSANLELNDSSVIFRGLAIKDSAIDEKNSFKAEKALSTRTVGSAKINQQNKKNLSHCSFAVKKSSSANDIWPKNLTDKLLQGVGKCLGSELCSALANRNL